MVLPQFASGGTLLGSLERLSLPVISSVRASAGLFGSRQLSSTADCNANQSPPASAQHSDPLKPYIPVWCMLPNVSPRDALVRSTEFISGAYSYSHLPPEKHPETAIVGRSNVGKSSLINYLVGRKELAMVSKHPGKTQSINHYLVNKSWCLVDCPGYGYAKVAKDKRADWNAFTQQYFKSRRTLTDVLLLVDASLPPKEMDLAGVSWLTKQGLLVTLVFTKIDKSKSKLPSPAQNILHFRAALEAEGGPLAIPPHFATSSAARKGKDDLLMYLARRRAQHAQQQQQAAAVQAAGTSAGQPATVA